MSLIKNCTVVICNGEIVGLHSNKDGAEQQAYEIAQEWRLHSDCGSEVRAPKLAVLDFNSWMQLQSELVF